MNFTFDSKSTQKSYFKSEDYFPVMIVFSEEELNSHFIQFSLWPTDMFELCVNSKTHVLKKLVFTLCNHVVVHNDQKITYPEHQEGCIKVSGPESNNYGIFITHIFTDGLRIELSDTPAVRHLKCGQLIFAFDPDNNLVSLYIVDLTEKDMNHIIKELRHKQVLN
ncbi:MAG: hypothetical protein Q4F00_08960 [bacterium]|nr:hypothetical protein [bacterium]